ncbi:hypothetical protein LZ318_01680 [Saccharopolyspora indica]|uniref:hypothetical protein n=1 Tax=Saccharopolyspora indica TaxID=1229659 RepID=UPI0022EA6A09|nr:hypothetical protein [Saccharopolyspora indica]MDA3650140.1 hypothetical protein [Saccharopolyspora indica]
MANNLGMLQLDLADPEFRAHAVDAALQELAADVPLRLDSVTDAGGFAQLRYTVQRDSPAA